MIANLIGGLVVADIGLMGIMNIIVNSDTTSKLHLLWSIPLFILGALVLGSSLRNTIM